MSAKELSMKIMEDVYAATGITAACGIGANLYLAKIALDITAKHVEDHIGILEEESYKRTLWSHKPLTDFWRIGSGIAKRWRGRESTRWRALRKRMRICCTGCSA